MSKRDQNSLDNPQERAKAEREPDLNSQAGVRQNQQQSADRSSLTPSNAEVGAASLLNQEFTRMQNKASDRPQGGIEGEYQGSGRSQDTEREPGRMQDNTSVRPGSSTREDIKRGYGSHHRGNEFDDVEVDQSEPEEPAA